MTYCLHYSTSPAGAFPFLFPSFFNKDLASELVDSVNQEGSLRVFCNGCAGSIWFLDGEAVCSPLWEKNHKKWNNNKRNKHNNNNNDNNIYYYSFNQNIRFWSAEIPQIIHHNRPLLTKWKKCAIIMWKMTSILQQNCQKTGQLIEKTWGWGLIVLVLRRHFNCFTRKK